jgi:hypothetical protein
MPDESYNDEELLGLADDAFPQRGEFCPRCRKFIPSFSDLSTEDIHQLRELPPAQAMRALRQKTNCNIVFAKIWAIHPTGPHAAKIHPPCPYCGTPLFSTGTRQCLKCGWDWHDKDNPKKLTGSVIEGIARGEAAIQKGQVLSHERVRERMKRWFRKKHASPKSKNPTER